MGIIKIDEKEYKKLLKEKEQKEKDSRLTAVESEGNDSFEGSGGEIQIPDSMKEVFDEIANTERVEDIVAILQDAGLVNPAMVSDMNHHLIDYWIEGHSLELADEVDPNKFSESVHAILNSIWEHTGTSHLLFTIHSTPYPMQYKEIEEIEEGSQILPVCMYLKANDKENEYFMRVRFEADSNGEIGAETHVFRICGNKVFQQLDTWVEVQKNVGEYIKKMYADVFSEDLLTIIFATSYMDHQFCSDCKEYIRRKKEAEKYRLIFEKLQRFYPFFDYIIDEDTEERIFALKFNGFAGIAIGIEENGTGKNRKQIYKGYNDYQDITRSYGEGTYSVSIDDLNEYMFATNVYETAYSESMIQWAEWVLDHFANAIHGTIPLSENTHMVLFPIGSEEDMDVRIYQKKARPLTDEELLLKEEIFNLYGEIFSDLQEEES